jgi:hypothetical protein
MRLYVGALLLVCLPALFAAADDRSADDQKAIDAVLKLGGKVTLDES